MTSRRELYAAGEPFGDSATRSKPFGRVYGGGGGGGGTSTTQMTIPNELKPAATALSKIATNVGNTGYTPYYGQGVADLNGYQQQGMSKIANRALSGDATVNSGANFLQQQLNSGPAGATVNPVGGVSAGWNNMSASAGYNPYANVQSTGNPYGQAQTGAITANISAGSNPYADVQASRNAYGYTNVANNNMQVNGGVNGSIVSAQTNPFLNNQYLEQNIDSALSDVTRNYMQNVRPAQVGSNVQSGSFGNSGLAEVQAMQENDLKKQMGSIASGMRMQDLQSRQQLAEAWINRDLQAKQFNANTTEQNLGRSLQAQLANLGTAESNIGRQFQNAQFNAGLAESQAARDMQAAQIRAQYGEEAANRFMQAQGKNADIQAANLDRFTQNSQFNANLGEAQAARDLQAQQIRAQYGEEAANRFMQAQQLNFANMDSNLARSMQAQQVNAQLGQDWAQRNDAMYNASMGQKMDAAQLGLNYGNQAYQDASQLMSAGQTAYNNAQDKLDFNYQQYQNQMDYPIKQLGALSGVISGNSGSTTTQTGGGK